MSSLTYRHMKLDPKTSEGCCGELRWVEYDEKYQSTGKEAFGSFPKGRWCDGGFCDKPAYGFSIRQDGYHDGVLRCPDHGGPKDKGQTGI